MPANITEFRTPRLLSNSHFATENANLPVVISTKILKGFEIRPPKIPETAVLTFEPREISLSKDSSDKPRPEPIPAIISSVVIDLSLSAVGLICSNGDLNTVTISFMVSVPLSIVWVILSGICLIRLNGAKNSEIISIPDNILSLNK